MVVRPYILSDRLNVMNWILSQPLPKCICWHSNSQHLWLSVTFFGDGIFTEVIQLKWDHWRGCWSAWCSYKNGKFGDRHTMWMWRWNLQANERGQEQILPFISKETNPANTMISNIGSRAARQWISMWTSPSLWYFVTTALFFKKRKYSLFKRLWSIIYSISRRLGNNSCWQNSPPSAIASTDERQISEGTVNSSVIKTLWYPEGKRL